MSTWKRALAVLLGVLLILSLQGCGYRELYERLLIHGIGVDVTEDGFLVTVRSSVSTQSEGEEFFRCEGSSVLEALTNLSLLTGREPFYSHNYLVVFGRACAEQGLDRCLDFFVRYYNTRPAVQMYMAEGSAEEILSCEKDGQLLKMSELQQLSDSGRSNGKALGAEILDFVNGVKREGSSPVLPVLRAGDSGVEVTATACFDGYRLKNTLTLEQTRGYMAAKNQLEKGEMVVDGDFGAVTLSLSRSDGKTAVYMDADRPVFTITVQVQADISAISGGRDRLSTSAYPQIEQAAATLLQEEILSTLDLCIRQEHCDIFGFGNLIYRHCPSWWRVNGPDWHTRMADCRYDVNTSVQVLRLEA